MDPARITTIKYYRLFIIATTLVAGLQGLMLVASPLIATHLWLCILLPVTTLALAFTLLSLAQRNALSLNDFPGLVVQVNGEGMIEGVNLAAQRQLQALQPGTDLLQHLNRNSREELTLALSQPDDASREMEVLLDHRLFRLAIAGSSTINNQRCIQLTDIANFRAMSERTSRNEQRFRSLFSENPDAVFSLDLDGHFIEANHATEELTGFQQFELANMSWSAIVEPADRDGLRDSYQAAQQGSPSSVRCEIKSRNGRKAMVYITHSPILVGGQVVGIFGVARDKTEQHWLEQQRHLLMACIEQVQDVILVTEATPLNKQGPRIVFANNALEKIVGYKPEEVLGRSPRLFQGPETDPKALKRIRNAIHQREPITETLINYRKDGKAFWNQISIVPITATRDGDHGYFASVQRDITETKQREMELHQSRNELRSLISAQDDNLEQERRRIARDLHDELGQTLTAIKLDLGLVMQDLAKTSPRHTARLNSLVGLVDGIIDQVREIAANLRPAMLDDLGFEAAAEWFLTQCAGRDGLAVHWQPAAGNGGRVHGDAATALYRILQECMTNISRHANANNVTIRYHETADQARLTIADDGVGFSPQHVSRGFGLVGMRERVAMFGGDMSIQSALGEGVQVQIDLPLNGETDD